MFMKGIFEMKPPTLRYNFIWDFGIVLDFIKVFLGYFYL